jgi:hypothetical protein
MLNFVKVIVQWLTNCVTSYASINLSEPEEAKVRTGCYTPFTKKSRSWIATGVHARREVEVTRGLAGVHARRRAR